MTTAAFDILLGEIAAAIADMPVDRRMETALNQRFGPETPAFAALRAFCLEGERDGWLLQRQNGDIKFGRVIKPHTKAGKFSVDVVRMKNVVGPHHVHTNGEIGLIIPIDDSARFDGKAEGWYVYPVGSDHHPTVSDGDAYVLYMLPDGAIEFTGLQSGMPKSRSDVRQKSRDNKDLEPDDDSKKRHQAAAADPPASPIKTLRMIKKATWGTPF